ncbi:hypothetical protein [Segnochrobactrum spirostomi]|uniref:Transmembrane protein n=1 Tax=Segnochrobactrum spirostomi TaxID=2608987 RepID=A0A6A7XY12_9HYPH|nr:hypothetical protein [Segnochrobactrum spirostomi]MQT11315.1 hypothetical protein [Segnochrobactrum spirostomi]
MPISSLEPIAVRLGRSRLGTPFFAACAVAIVVLLAVGLWRSYVPVPLFDTWDGAFGFYFRAADGDWSAWFGQHNEHRLILSRLFFWLDIAVFRGSVAALVALNVVLLGAVVAVFLAFAAAAGFAVRSWFGLFLVCWLASFMQQGNLVWEFQSQFWLAQLLPLTGLYCLYRARESGSSIAFALGMICGILAAGAMANGILALPVFTLYAATVRFEWTKIAITAGLGVLVITAYLHGYTPPGGGRGLLANALAHRPVDLAEYYLLLLGTPFHTLTGKGAFGRIAAIVASLVLLGGFVVFLRRALMRQERAALELALLAFLVFLFLSADLVACGRIDYGPYQALISRYKTPALMAWATFWILCAHASVRSPKEISRLQICFAALSLALVAAQASVFWLPPDASFDKKVVALALTLGAQDDARLASLYPDPKALRIAARRVREDRLSIFGDPTLADAEAAMGRQWITEVGAPPCRGRVDRIDPLPGDNRFVRIRGWIFNPAHGAPPGDLAIVDPAGTIVGFALVGKSRPELVETLETRTARYAGFEGYALAATAATGLALAPLDRSCILRPADRTPGTG